MSPIPTTSQLSFSPTIERLATTDLPVLVCGETGVGKEVVAAALHSWSKRRAGKSVAVMQIGSSQHYALGRLAEKYGFDLKGVRVVPVQSGANEASAVVGGQVDAAVVPETYVKSALEAGDAKLIGWVGDETPWQLGGVFISTKTADTRADTVRRAITDKHIPSANDDRS